MVALLFTLFLAAQLPAPMGDRASAAAELAAARQLYASASYEEALDRLGRVTGADALADQVDTYRALCLLALGRSRESERVIENILQRNPKFTLDEQDTSPRLVMVFKGVQARMLPVAARGLYAAARESYDKKQYDTAVRQLRDVLELLDTDKAPGAGSTDLRVLADEFLRLAESKAGPASRPVASGDEQPEIYSLLDRDIIAPVEISRHVPVMEAPRGEKPGLYQGVVEIVVGVTGRVEQAIIRRSINPAFDADIISATGQWRFQPATKNGKAVRFRRSYEIIGHSK